MTIKSSALALCLCLVSLGCATASKSQLERAPVGGVVWVPDVVVEPAMVEERPSVYVHIESVSDRSAGIVSAENRRVRADAMRDLIRKELAAAPAVTLEPTGADSHRIRQYTVDATIERLDRRVRGHHVEVVCELRLSISDQRGRMLSFLTGGVAVQVPKTTFRPQYEPQLQREALEGAAKKINRDLLAYIDGDVERY